MEFYFVTRGVIGLESNKGVFMSFKVGDRAVYPGHGLGRITAIETKDIMGARQRFTPFY